MFSTPYAFVYGKLKEIYENASEEYRDELFEIKIDYVLNTLKGDE